MRTLGLRREDGAALVEFAIVAPLLVILVFGVVDLGRALYTHVTIQEAAQEGALYGSFAPGNHADTVERVRTSMQNPAIAFGDVAVTCIAPDPLDPDDTRKIAVRVTHTLDFITPMSSWFGGSVTLDKEVVSTIFSEDSCDPTP